MSVVYRRTVVLLVGLLVLSLVSVTQAAGAFAAAQTKYGQKVAWQSEGGISLGPVPLSAQCQGNAWWVAERNAGLIRYGMKWNASNCRQSVDAPDVGDARTFEARGVSGSAASCYRTGSSAVSDRSGNVTLYSWREQSSTVWLGYEDDPSDELVTPLPGLDPSVCVPTLIVVNRNGDSEYKFPVNLGLRPTFGAEDSHAGTCPVGTPKSVNVRLAIPNAGSVEAQLGLRKVVVDIEFREPGSGRWQVLPIWQTSNAPYVTGGNVVHDGTMVSASTGYDLGAGVSSFEARAAVWNTPPQYPLLGVHLIAGTASADNNWNPGNPPGATASGTGRTDPGKCWFYLGTRLFNSATTEDDTPWATGSAVGSDLEPEPDEVAPEEPPPAEEVLGPDERCNFDIGDPSTWASGALCGVVTVLMKILGAVLDLVGAVLGLPAKILDGLVALFIPDNAVIAGQTDTLRSAWSDSTPGGYAEDVGTLVGAVSFSEAGSCKGPTMGIPHAGEFAPLNACGDAGQIAGVVRGGITAMIWLGAGLVVLRLVGSSIGLNMEGFGREAS